MALAQEARVRQEAATARWEATQADAAERNKMLDGLLTKQDKLIAKADTQLKEMRAERVQAEARFKSEREDERIWRREAIRRQEKMFQHYLQRADQTLAEMQQQTADIKAELRDQHDERRAFREAILKLIDRLPPPPPHLRSA